jgi:hypothetical protein
MRAPGQAAERTFTGGLWSPEGSAIWPLARLELLDSGIRVRGGIPGLRWLVPAWQTTYGDITVAQLIAVPPMSRGVYLVTTEMDSIVFWTRRGSDILDHLQVHGVPSDRSVSRPPWGANAYHP